MAESLEQASRRVLEEKAGLGNIFVEQLYTFGDVQRDPRARVISVAYVALVDAARFALRAPSDVAVARLVVPFAGETGGPVDIQAESGEPLPLAFDHALILGMAVKRLRGKLDYTPVGFQLLGDEFSLRELQEVHETIRGEPVNKDSFRRRMLASGLIEATGAREAAVSYRPAELYRFTKRSAT
jgi:8-oxo-dGTP diphosphatase